MEMEVFIMGNSITYDVPIMEAKEAWEKLIGKDRLCEGKFYELINRQGCPKIVVGRKYLIPVQKFLEWLENQAVI